MRVYLFIMVVVSLGWLIGDLLDVLMSLIFLFIWVDGKGIVYYIDLDEYY